jgi:hypothetical protein
MHGPTHDRPSGHKKCTGSLVILVSQTNANKLPIGTDGFQARRAPHIFATEQALTDSTSGSQTPISPVKQIRLVVRRSVPARSARAMAGVAATSMPRATLTGLPSESSLINCRFRTNRPGQFTQTAKKTRHTPTMRQKPATSRCKYGALQATHSEQNMQVIAAIVAISHDTVSSRHPVDRPPVVRAI